MDQAHGELMPGMQGGPMAVGPVSISRSVDIKATPDRIWAAIGRFSSIGDWHPAIVSCTEDGKTPPTRRLIAAGGVAPFIERETSRNDGQYHYSYCFVSSPLPVKNYSATLEVFETTPGCCTVTWSGSYFPDDGTDEEVGQTIINIYEQGLASVYRQFDASRIHAGD